jgi:hypothetical protein
MKKSGLWKQRQGQLGVNAVERIVLHGWQSRWQSIDATNDDGVDGLIIAEKGGSPTGQVIFVQVKCSPKSGTASHFKFPVNIERMNRNLRRWRRLVGAAIVIWVDPDSAKAFWANLRDPETIVGTQIFVPKSNVFNEKAKRNILSLCGTLHADLLLRRIATTAVDFHYLLGAASIKSGAREVYRNLEASELKFEGSPQNIGFTREGWHHLTRRNRAPMARFQSLCLLGAVEKIVRSTHESELRTVRPAKGREPELVAASATIVFPFRQSAVVMVVFRKRLGANNEANYSFHTIHEPRRKRDLWGLGGHEAVLHS